MPNSMSMTATGSIQITDLNTPGQPIFYTRSFSASISNLNLITQTINLTGTFAVPITGVNPYALIYVRNLMPVTYNSTLFIALLGGNLQLGGQAWLFLANPVPTEQTPLASMTLSASGNLYPLLAEYGFATNQGAL